MKVVDAVQYGDRLIAKVRFADGLEQSVSLPATATKQDIKDEAKRLRDAAEAFVSERVVRADLED